MAFKCLYHLIQPHFQVHLFNTPTHQIVLPDYLCSTVGQVCWIHLQYLLTVFISSIEGSNAEGSINIEIGEDDHGRPVIRFTASPNVSVPTNPSEAIDRGLYFCHAYLPNRLDTYRNMIGGSSVWGASPSSMPASSLDNYVSTSSTLSSALLFQDTRNQSTDTSSPASVLPPLVDNSLWFENRNCSYICEIQQGYNLIQCLF